MIVINKWGEEVKILKKVGKKYRVQILNECNDIYEFYITVQNGCVAKNRKTKSMHGIGFLDCDVHKKFKYSKKEYYLWKGLMNKYKNKGIQYEQYCSFVNFCKALRKHEQYNDILYNDTVIMTDIGENGEIRTNRRYSHKNVKVKRTNMRTGKTYTYDSLEDCSIELAIDIEYLRKVVNKDKLIKNSKFEYIED